MASAAPSHTRCGVMVCMPSGIGLTVMAYLHSLLRKVDTALRPPYSHDGRRCASSTRCRKFLEGAQRDCEFQAATFAVGNVEFGIVARQHAVHDGQAQSGA